MAALSSGLIAGSAIGGAVTGGLMGLAAKKRKGGDGLLSGGLAAIPGMFGNAPAEGQAPATPTTPTAAGGEPPAAAPAGPGVKRRRKGSVLQTVRTQATPARTILTGAVSGAA